MEAEEDGSPAARRHVPTLFCSWGRGAASWDPVAWGVEGAGSSLHRARPRLRALGAFSLPLFPLSLSQQKAVDLAHAEISSVQRRLCGSALETVVGR